MVSISTRQEYACPPNQPTDPQCQRYTLDGIYFILGNYTAFQCGGVIDSDFVARSWAAYPRGIARGTQGLHTILVLGIDHRARPLRPDLLPLRLSHCSLHRLHPPRLTSPCRRRFHSWHPMPRRWHLTAGLRSLFLPASVVTNALASLPSFLLWHRPCHGLQW